MGASAMVIRARPFDFPHDGRLDPRALALLAIDLQVDFLSHDGYFARMGYDPTPLRAVLPAVERVAAAVRAVGGLVVHTRQGYRADLADMTPYEHWRRRQSGLEGTDVLVRGSAGFQIDPAVTVAPQDVVVDKTTNGAFTHTDLEHVLRARGITHLLFAGCTTDVCVHSTLREACDRNFQCLTVVDAVASGDPVAHAGALHMVTVEYGVFGCLADADAVVVGLEAGLPTAS